ncbi:ATPase [Jidongwangia harbinensis]|uniref:ATPase n=1 Tax=Jidongwangia harbinensis TaxID=2878561 RepID=UPI001CD9AF4B|nr:ATPase [Jidongwangia harbinensis]MCA2218799.1 ATPase [Jidongwangia harbinensis]
MTVDCDVRADDGRLIARLTGRLGMADVADVRLHLMKCLAEQPDALLVDLSGVVVGHPTAPNVFAAVARQAALWPATPVLFCGAPPEMTAPATAALFRRLPLFDSVEMARAHLAGGGHAQPTVIEELLPVTGAPRRGRDVVTDACLRWDVPHLVAPASLICTEFISNVADHVGTLMTLRLSLTPRLLLIAVRDGSPVEPVAASPGDTGGRGRGLQIVDATAHAWGWVPARDGKAVWGSLRIEPR